MILYNETVNIDNTVAEEWLQWIKEVHIPDVMGTGYFLRNQICRLMDEVDNGGTTYAVQYTCRSLQDLEEYQRDHAPEIQERHMKRYEGKYVIFSTLLEVVGVDVEREKQA